MPKKPAVENNSKKAQGQARKAATADAKKSAASAASAAAEAAEWSKGAKSNSKAEAEAAKKAEAARKKAEKEALLAAEEAALKSAKPSASKDKSSKAAAKKAPLPTRGIDGALGAIDGGLDGDTGSEQGKALRALAASGIDDAIDALTIATTDANAASVERHPERRVKAVYAAYEERRLPELRKEHPGLRLNQMKDMLWKEFEKSPENPMNQVGRNVRYDATKDEIREAKERAREATESRLAGK